MTPEQWRELKERVESVESALLGTLDNKGQGLVSAQETMAKELYGETGIIPRMKKLENFIELQRQASWFRAGWIAGASAAGGAVVWGLQKLFG